MTKHLKTQHRDKVAASTVRFSVTEEDGARGQMDRSREEEGRQGVSKHISREAEEGHIVTEGTSREEEGYRVHEGTENSEPLKEGQARLPFTSGTKQQNAAEMMRESTHVSEQQNTPGSELYNSPALEQVNTPGLALQYTAGLEQMEPGEVETLYPSQTGAGLQEVWRENLQPDSTDYY